ncbi:TonB-dependent siderophore receptor [Croceitalea dokdonensis DOKDO 023]|uniref:TonB-dependent siderophore receptor n=1 Tax=Croceitalea dokdonensis DOKDO 023 TaxID=1300341 RepID=A0A0P7AUW5_9FLAO|nr:TonB-dependent receptor [Croceitalea dokdonensis]KPM31641.1 TonB-dependent siderophore receptor [Croceitalea dokdonensis DOKDO 023]
MKTNFILFFCLHLSVILFSQTQIQGTILDENDRPLMGATVILSNYGGATTDEKGHFKFLDIANGTYTITVSYIGYTSQSKKQVVFNEDNIVVDFFLNANTEALQAVEIIGRRATTYKNELSFGATKTATLIKDTPQAISYVTKEVMEDRQAFRVNDVVKNISGINQFSYYNDFTIRGFRSQQELINGLRVIGLFGPQILTSNLERVEVIKGPASAVFGNSSPGGTMNRVTKKPLAEERKAITFTTGSFNTQRATLDFTGPLDKKGTLLYRLNIGFEDSNDFRDIQEFNSLMIAPSISFLPSDRTQLNFDLVLTSFDGKLDRGQPIFGASAGTDLNSTPISFAIGAANDYHETQVAYSTLSLNHKFTDNFSFNASYMRYAFKEDLFEHRTSNRFAVDGAGNEIPTLMGMRISAREQERINDNVSTYFLYEGKTGQLTHKLLAGYDYIQSVRPVGGGGIFTSSGAIYRTVDGGLANYDPEEANRFLLDDNGNPVPNIPHFNLQDPTYLLGFPSDYILGRNELAAQKFFTNGLYIQDQIKFKKLQVLIGLRQEWYTDKLNFEQADEQEVRQSAFLPRFGFVYSLNQSTNVYATYTESFQPQNPVDITGNINNTFDPQLGTMFEVGAKSTFFNDRLAVNLAAYEIKNQNILYEDQTTGLLVQRGAEEAKGIEVDVNGKIGRNFNISANYAYNVATITNSDDITEIGRRKENAPLNSGGFFANYKFDQGFFRDLNINLGSNFVSSRNTFEKDLVLPEYMVWDAGLAYKINKVKIALTFNNIFNKTHWVGGYSYVRLFPGAPRNYLLSVGYTF